MCQFSEELSHFVRQRHHFGISLSYHLTIISIYLSGCHVTDYCFGAVLSSCSQISLPRIALGHHDSQKNFFSRDPKDENEASIVLFMLRSLKWFVRL